jgi:hypothetical protein
MRKCADCALLHQRISDLNNELLVLRIAALTAKNKSVAGKKSHVNVAAKMESQLKSSRRQSAAISSSSPVFTS